MKAPPVDRRLSLITRKALLRIERRIKDGFVGEISLRVHRGSQVRRIHWITYPEGPP